MAHTTHTGWDKDGERERTGRKERVVKRRRKECDDNTHVPVNNNIHFPKS